MKMYPFDPCKMDKHIECNHKGALKTMHDLNEGDCTRTCCYGCGKICGYKCYKALEPYWKDALDAWWSYELNY